MGITGSGKSTLINQLVDEEVTVGHDLNSCKPSAFLMYQLYRCNSLGTSEVGLYSFVYNDNNKSRRVVLIDTPGFDDTHRTDIDIRQEISFVLPQTYEQGINLAGIIYLHRITDVRMQGSSLKNLTMFQKLCGEGFYNHVVLATTMWGRLGKDEQDADEGGKREKELVNTKK